MNLANRLTVSRLIFLLDFPTYSAMRVRGMDVEMAAATATQLALRWLGFDHSIGPAKGGKAGQSHN